MRVYVASSWRNTQHPAVVVALREAGHQVYDFRNRSRGNHGFHWSQIDPAWQSWTPSQFLEALHHPLSQDGFRTDMMALFEAEAVVLVLPSGRSSHLELGYAKGCGKYTVVLLASGEPELMYLMGDVLCISIPEVVHALACWPTWIGVCSSQ